MKYLSVAHLTLEKISAAHLVFGWARLGHLTILFRSPRWIKIKHRLLNLALLIPQTTDSHRYRLHHTIAVNVAG